MNTEHLRSGISRHRSVSSVARIKYWRLTFLQTTFVRVIHVYELTVTSWSGRGGCRASDCSSSQRFNICKCDITSYLQRDIGTSSSGFWGDKSTTFRRKHAHFLTLTSGFVSKLTQLTWSTSVVLQKHSLPTFIQVNGEQLAVITRVKVGKVKQNYRSYKTVFYGHITVHVLCAG